MACKPIITIHTHREALSFLIDFSIKYGGKLYYYRMFQSLISEKYVVDRVRKLGNSIAPDDNQRFRTVEGALAWAVKDFINATKKK